MNLFRLNPRHVLPDIVLIVLSFYLSLYLRLGSTDEFFEVVPVLNKYIPFFLLLRVATFALSGVYNIIWRYVSLQDAVRLARAIFFSFILVIATTYLLNWGFLPRSMFFIDSLLNLAFVGGIRIVRRFVYDRSAGKDLNALGRRVLIYGAGNNGRTLAQRFKTDSQLRYNVIGYVDDDKRKIGRNIGGVTVLGDKEKLQELVKGYNIHEVIFAMSTPPGNLVREVIELLRPFRIIPRTVMSMSSGANQRDPLQLIKNVELSDLLGRSQKEIDMVSVRDLLKDKRVLISGAGGSIGSELARQVNLFSPAQLVLLDHSEFNLYQIDRELRSSTDESGPVVPVLCDLKDSATLDRCMSEYRPQVIFHAAAYKHVHLVEKNPLVGILNNIWGTFNLLSASKHIGVDSFVLISSDKAVNPVGLMGATKRVCEMLVTSFGRGTSKRYCSVRFGNVLGSSGSLVPLITEQIQKGMPVTVTDKEMTRYFMLIPEAVSLVLKAGSIAEPGDIAILRMGEPISIYELVKNLITLMGKTADEVPIIFTGKRPGEKMFEELYLSGKELNTQHDDILILPKGDSLGGFDPSELLGKIESIIASAQNGDLNAVNMLRDLVHGTNSTIKSLTSGTEASEDEDGPRIIN